MLMFDPAQVRTIEAAKRLLTEVRRVDAWIARELEAIPPWRSDAWPKRGRPDSVAQHHVAKVG